MPAPKRQGSGRQHYLCRHSGGHNTDWTAQDELRKTTQGWVEKANAANTERTRQESTQHSGPVEEDLGSPDPVWQALVGSVVILTMEKLLQLVPRVRRTIEDRITRRSSRGVSTNFTGSSDGPTVVDHSNPAIKVILQGQEVVRCIIDGGSGINVISARICEQLGISEWEACPFWLRMADTRSVRPLRLIMKLGIVVGGHRFEISAVVLDLDNPGAYPILLGRPWLRSANIKQSWEHNSINFRRGRTKVRVPTEEAVAQLKNMTPLYAEDINMLEGVDDKELEAYLEEHPRIIPLFEIDVIEVAADYATRNSVNEAAYEPDPTSIMNYTGHVRHSKRKWRFLGESRPQY